MAASIYLQPRVLMVYFQAISREGIVMLIIKPYGKSAVKNQKRSLLQKEDWKTEKDIPAFVSSHPEAVIAQWISMIDKIATKPQGNKAATPAQDALREKLGKAAWDCLENNSLIPTEKEVKDKLKKIWDWKIAPYGSNVKEDRHKRISVQGRWYNRFLGEGTASESIDANAVAEKIYQHLHKNQLRITTDRPGKSKGLIQSRAESISGNVLKGIKKEINSFQWNGSHKEEYKKADNIARSIKNAIEQSLEGTERSYTHSQIAAKALFTHWQRIFIKNNSAVMNVNEAKEQKPGLFGLHMAVKDYYKRTLKGHNKKGGILRILPNNMEELYKKLEQQKTNQNVNALIRLGKIVHYTASGSNADTTQSAIDNWPSKNEIENSPYWNSSGQAQIKRNEAFVRIWRLVLAHAARTLKNWGDPDNTINTDILMKREDVCKKYKKNGQSVMLFNSNRFDDNKYLGLALKGIYDLRNSSFHFKGLGEFVAVLQDIAATDEMLDPEITKFWNEENEACRQRLSEIMKGSHFLFFFDTDQNKKLYEALSSPCVTALPLPRFRRILLRFENAWKKGEKAKLPLPAPAKREKLEEYPALQCRYTALKLLYERPFRSWLENCPKESLNDYIKKSVKRTTDVAQTLNKNDVIAARAAQIGIDDTQNFQEFFFRLSSVMASEMRIQRGYESNAEEARKQTEYIENLKYDVLLLAFQDFLCERNLAFTTEINESMEKPEKPLCEPGILRSETPQQDNGEDWQHLLYFLIHLVPVEEISTLLHQIRKWDILAEKAEDEVQSEKPATMKLQQVLELYIERHDAKFTGGMQITVRDGLKELFETKEGFDKIFPAQPSLEADSNTHIPLRGLREMQRFGDLSVLIPVFKIHKITDEDISDYLAQEKDIVEAHKTRENLHAELSRDKKKQTPEKLKSYAKALQTVIRYRELSAHILLTNHVRLHRLLMAVLGRLIDYAGLWERDIYFVTLAVLYQNGQKTAKNILDAHGNVNTRNMPREIEQALKPYFDFSLKDIRNDFAHFNMLQRDSGKDIVIDLAELVNNARQLMSYDRKLKNAVSKSIIELLQREGIVLSWVMQEHNLVQATLRSEQICHLENQNILENLHGYLFIKMAADLFQGGLKREEKKQITDLKLDKIDWNAQKQRGHGRGKRGRKQNFRTKNRRNTRRNQKDVL